MSSRPEVIAVTDSELVLRMGGCERTAPWSAVTGISAGRAKVDRTSDHWILILAIELSMEDREHLVLIGEIEPSWVALTTILPTVLPGVPLFERWAAELVTATAPMELFERAGQVS